MNNLGKNLALWVIVGLLLVALFNLFEGVSAMTRRRNSLFPNF